MTLLDRDAQPTNRAFGAARINDRKIDELIGICRGILADGALSLGEAQFMQDWLQANKDIINHWPASILFSRIESALADGNLDSDEEKDLLETLMQATGDPPSNGQMRSNASGLPLCDPYPDIEFSDHIFCFTGKFATGSRNFVQDLVGSMGATSKSGPSRKVDFLVIGSVGSADWIHSTHGRKIEKAVMLRTAGERINIVSEEHWYNSIPPHEKLKTCDGT